MTKASIKTTTGQVEVFQKALTSDLKPPESVPMDEIEIIYWDDVLSMKPKSDWTQHDLVLAAMLCRDLAALEEGQRKIKEEGFVVTTTGGNMAKNPRASANHELKASIKSLRQTLGIHDRGVNGEKRDADKRRKIAGQIESTIDDMDDLIARPSMN